MSRWNKPPFPATTGGTWAGTWQVDIWDGDCLKNLYRFDTEENARTFQAAYNEWAKLVHAQCQADEPWDRMKPHKGKFEY